MELLEPNNLLAVWSGFELKSTPVQSNSITTIRASPKDVNSQGKTKLLELDEDEEELRTRKSDHRDNLKLYRKQLSALDTLRS